MISQVICTCSHLPAWLPNPRPNLELPGHCGHNSSTTGPQKVTAASSCIQAAPCRKRTFLPFHNTVRAQAGWWVSLLQFCQHRSKCLWDMEFWIHRWTSACLGCAYLQHCTAHPGGLKIEPPMPTLNFLLIQVTLLGTPPIVYYLSRHEKNLSPILTPKSVDYYFQIPVSKWEEHFIHGFVENVLKGN